MNFLKNKRFVFITGLSGSGKSMASQFLEDIGYYCIDNLPVKLIPQLVDLWTRKEVEIEKAALVVDIREASFAEDFPRVWRSIRKAVNPILIFLDASDSTLIKRFSESRRPHPLSVDKSIAKVIAEERRSLAEIKRMSDEVLDTSDMKTSQLKEWLTSRFSQGKINELKIVVLSFGYKYGLPLDSDLVFDVRCLPNPFYIDRLREKTGKVKSVKNYIYQFEDSKTYIIKLKNYLDYLLLQFKEKGKNFLTVSIGCTGGRHRSVAVAEDLIKHLSNTGFEVSVYHRDVYK